MIINAIQGFEMKERVLYFIALVVVFVSFQGCSGNKNELADDIVYVTVNGSQLTDSELHENIPDDVYDKLTKDQKIEIIKEWIDSELLYHEALEREIDKDSEIQRILETTRRNLLKNELLKRFYTEIQPPNDEVLKNFYEEQENYFILTENEYSIRYALFDSEEDAQDFWENVKKGVSFSELARRSSKDPSYQTGGNLGIVNEDIVEPEVWKVIQETVANLGLVKISDPFQTSEGWACIIVDEEFEAGTIKPFRYIRIQIVDLYLLEKQKEMRKSILEKLENEAKIEYNPSYQTR